MALVGEVVLISEGGILRGGVVSVALVSELCIFSSGDSLGKYGNRSLSTVSGISLSKSVHVPSPCASYARRCSCRTPSWIQRSIRGERALRQRLKKIKKLQERIMMKARPKTLMLLVESIECLVENK
jgi:hypothetical protein